MHYQKPALNFSQQADLLIGRGLIGEKSEIEDFLSHVNYYRFSGYLYPFRSGNDDTFIKGIEFNHVRNIYNFDSALRHLVFSTIEIIDVTILRTRMVEAFSLKCGAFCYCDPQNFHTRLGITKHQEILTKIQNNVDQSQEEFVKKYLNKYKKENHLPFWMISEVSTFGILSTIYQYLPFDVKAPIANRLNLHSNTLESWLRSINTVRNICAHHSRLWNRKLPNPPMIPNQKALPEFHSPQTISNRNFFAILAILEFLMKKINPDIKLIIEFNTLLSKFPGIPLNKMGFPGNWQKYSLFQ